MSNYAYNHRQMIPELAQKQKLQFNQRTESQNELVVEQEPRTLMTLNIAEENIPVNLDGVRPFYNYNTTIPRAWAKTNSELEKMEMNTNKMQDKIDDVTYIDSADLLIQLNGCAKDRVPNDASSQPKEIYSILLVDTRPRAIFERKYIKKSLNIHFLPLTRNRLKKKMFSNFNILECIADQESKVIYENWMRNDVKRCIVVIPDDIWNRESEAYTFYVALTNGLSNEIFKSSNNIPQIAVLKGGLAHFSKVGSGHMVTAIDDEIPQRRGSALPTLDVAVRAGAKPALALKLNQAPSKSKPNSTKTEQNLDSSTAILQLTQLKSSLSSIRSLSSDDSEDSAYDNAAPQYSYSRISHNVIIGSDEIPLSSNAVTQLQQIKVTHILNMAAEVKNSFEVENSGLFKIKWIPVCDNTEQDMDEPLKEAIDFMSKITI